MSTIHRRAASLATALLALACGAQGPGPEPEPAPGPGAFDCDSPAQISGVIDVEDPVEGRYIVVMHEPAAGMRPAADAIAALTRDYAVRDVTTFSASLEGFACGMD